MKRSVPLVVFVFGALVITAGVLALADRGPFERGVAGTEQIYWDTALGLHKGEFDNEAVSGIRGPLYPRLLMAFVSEEPGAVRTARRAMTAIALPLLGLMTLGLAWRRTAPWPATVAGLGGMLSGAFVLQAGSFTPAVPAGLLILLAILLADGKPPVGTWLGSGLLVGLVFRLEPALAWAALVLLGLIPLVDRNRPRRFVALALLVVGCAAGSTAVGTVLGQGNILPAIPGTEVYLGHHTAASGIAPRRSDGNDVRYWGIRDFQVEASRRLERRVTLPEADGYWRGQALVEMFQAPHRELMRTAVKLYASLQADPVPRDVSAAFIASVTDKAGLGIALWLGRILLPLGLVGLLLAGRRAGLLLWAAVLTAPLAACISYASPGFRVATLVALASGLAFFIQALRGRRWIPAVAGGLAAVAVLGILPGFGAVPGMKESAEDHFMLGTLFDREGRGSAAMREYDRALRMAPDYPYPRLAVARMLARDQVTEEAVKELEAVRARYPRLVAPLTGLAQLYTEQKRFGDAIAVNEALVQVDPYNPDPLNNLGTVYLMGGLYSQAEQAFRRALAADPDYVPAQRNLQGMVEQGLVVTGGGEADVETSLEASRTILSLLQAGMADSAQAVLQRSYARFGSEDTNLLFTDGTLRLFTGDPQGAIERYEPLRGARGDLFFLNNLAVAYAQSGRLEEAEAVWAALLKANPTNEVLRKSLGQVRARIAARDSAAGN